MKLFHSRFLLGFSLLLSLGCGSALAGEITAADLGLMPSVQLAQSVPVETDLAQPGLPTTRQVWIDMIKEAKTTLDIAQFYVSARPKGDGKKYPGDDPLEEVLEELERAAKRGVRIRLLVSHALLSEDPETVMRFKKMRSASVRSIDLSKLGGGVHHAKYWVVDQKVVFVGSANFDWRALEHIHELGARVQDPEIAKQLGKIFEVDWRVAQTEQAPAPEMLATPYVPVHPETKPIELVSGPDSMIPMDIRFSPLALVELIRSAKKTIKVQLMDYSPAVGQVYWPDLDNALRAAALRGVKIQMMVSNGSSSLKSMDYLKSLALIPGVEIKMVTIPAHSGGEIPYARLIHSKYMVVDESALWLGTSNWSRGYFYNSRNVELIFRRADLALSGNQIFQKLWNYSSAEKIDPIKPAPIPTLSPLPQLMVTPLPLISPLPLPSLAPSPLPSLSVTPLPLTAPLETVPSESPTPVPAPQVTPGMETPAPPAVTPSASALPQQIQHSKGI